ncbi:Heterokaryon incompatibility [Botryosphaeria dothidea]|uniref:Heterokaryon incompatibility n=1 Tax=Botryosphaeria dothidea TaxID=55169 RepID=A0A8H4J730_9PEZI|nr:Heterokaryon incompatibility [Botryosphaeria dothidea]
MSDYGLPEEDDMDLDGPQAFQQHQAFIPHFDGQAGAMQQQPMKSAFMRQQLQQAQRQPVSSQLRQQMEQPMWAPSYSSAPAQRVHMSHEVRQQMLPPAPQSHQFTPSGHVSAPTYSQSQGSPHESPFQSHFFVMPHDFFEYEPLRGPGEIRILRINPGNPDDALDCELYHTNIHSNWEYHALSYAWGDSASKAEITCTGKRLRITTSLHGALRRIRNANFPIQVWADAVCINQQDVDERGHQVRLMRSIYKRAKSVFIWLGPDEQRAAPAVFASARKIFLKDMINIPPPDDSIWVGFALLFSRAWFWRLWCLQEIVLASSAEIIWGTESISWECLGFAAAWIRTVGYQILRNTPIQGVHNAYLMYALSLGSDKHDPVSFLHLLTLTRQFRVSDPRDRIYALLGLPTIDSDPDNGILYVDPDYTKTTQDVYEILARKMVISSQGLRTLSAVQHGLEVQEHVPSWVPQWDHLFTYTLAQAGGSLKNHAASASLLASLPRVNGPILSVDGLEFDTVAQISDVLPDSLDPSSPANFEYIKIIWDSMAAPLQAYPTNTNTDLYTAFCWTITAGKDWYGMLIEHELEHLADFAAFQTTHFDAPLPDAPTRDRLMPFGIPETARQEMLKMPGDKFYRTIASFQRQRGGEPGESTADADRFVTALSYACRWRRFFVTRRGFMGIGPPCMREGDVVGVLCGGIVPFLLRRRGGAFCKLVGEAYIYGIMKGEACVQPLRGNLELRTFGLT